jgi:ADP-ribose pyrophosphatase YjhB (NUDIX family)
MRKTEKTITATDRYGKNHTVSISDVKWRPSVYGVIIRDGKILLCSYKQGGYSLPGGGEDMDENIEQAVEREIKEETGIDAKFEQLLDVRENFFFTDDFHRDRSDTYHSTLFYCKMRYLKGEISTDGFDDWEKEYMLPAEWVDLSRLDEIAIADTVDWREIVKKLCYNTNHECNNFP